MDHSFTPGARALSDPLDRHRRPRTWTKTSCSRTILSNAVMRRSNQSSRMNAHRRHVQRGVRHGPDGQGDRPVMKPNRTHYSPALSAALDSFEKAAARLVDVAGPQIELSTTSTSNACRAQPTFESRSKASRQADQASSRCQPSRDGALAAPVGRGRALVKRQDNLALEVVGL